MYVLAYKMVSFLSVLSYHDREFPIPAMHWLSCVLGRYAGDITYECKGQWKISGAPFTNMDLL